jgi:hypothetical protein
LAVLEVATEVPTALCPVILVKGRRLHTPAHFAAPLQPKVLKRPVDNVASSPGARATHRRRPRAARAHAAAAGGGRRDD